MRLRRKEPRNLLRTSVISYCVILCVMIVGALAAGLIGTAPRIRADIDKANVNTLKNIRQFADQSLREIDRASVSLVSSSDVRRVILDNMKISYPRAQSLVNFMEVVTSTTGLHDLIAHISTYSESSGYIYTIGAYVPAEDFPDKSWIGYYETPGFNSGWTGTRDTRWILTGSIKNETIQEKLITLLRLYPLNAITGQQRGALMLHVRESDFRQMLKNGISDETDLLVLDKDGYVVSGSGQWTYGTDILEVFDLDEISSASAAETGMPVKLNGVASRVYSDVSDYTGWHFLLIVDESAVFKPIEELRMALSWGAVIMMAIALAAVFFINRWVYSPVQRFVGSLYKILNPQPEFNPVRAMSFEHIAGQFADIITDRERIQRQLSVSLPAVRRQQLVEILMGFAGDYSAVEGQLKYLGAYLLPANYIVILIKVMESENSNTPAITRAVTGLLADFAEKRMEKSGYTVVLDNGAIAGILSFHYERPSENMETALDIAQLIVNDAELELHVTAYVGIGEHYSSFSDISRSYQEAVEAISRGSLNENANIARYRDLPNTSEPLPKPTNQTAQKAASIEVYLQRHYADPMLSQTSVAEALGLSPSYVSRLFRQELNKGFTEALSTIRIEKAKELLKLPGTSVSEAAEAVGYTSIHTFIRTFKKLAGDTPGKWMKNNEL